MAIKFFQSSAKRLSLNRVGFTLSGKNVDDLAYLLAYLDKVNYPCMTGLEVDFNFYEAGLFFTTKEAANAFLVAFNDEQALVPTQAPITQS